MALNRNGGSRYTPPRQASGESVKSAVRRGGQITQWSSQEHSLSKKLEIAGWRIGAIEFSALAVTIALATTWIIYPHCTIFGLTLALILPPLALRALLTRAVTKKFEQFEKDFHVFLLALSGVLRSGIELVRALRIVANQFDEDSHVRREIDLLIDRIRVGVPEEYAFLSLGEILQHPEMILLRRSIVLSRRCGGQLSSIIERLADQVKNRTIYRQRAQGAIAMERMSIWVISFVMTFVLGFLTLKSPELVSATGTTELGKQITEGGLLLIILGFLWSYKITNVKV